MCCKPEVNEFGQSAFTLELQFVLHGSNFQRSVSVKLHCAQNPASIIIRIRSCTAMENQFSPCYHFTTKLIAKVLNQRANNDRQKGLILL